MGFHCDFRNLVISVIAADKNFLLDVLTFTVSCHNLKCWFPATELTERILCLLFIFYFLAFYSIHWKQDNDLFEEWKLKWNTNTQKAILDVLSVLSHDLSFHFVCGRQCSARTDFLFFFCIFIYENWNSGDILSATDFLQGRKFISIHCSGSHVALEPQVILHLF